MVQISYRLDVTETPREFAFCAHAIVCHDDLLIVNDAREDERFFDNPLVIDQPNVIFYAGHVLRSKEGYRLGTLCVIDNKPKQLSEIQINSLRIIANQVMHLLELKKTKAELKKINIRLEEKNINIENQSFQINTNLKELEGQKRINDNILYNMLPEEVTSELKKTGTYKPKAFSSVSILITDFKDFTRMSENISAELLVDELNYCFSKFDEIISKYNIEKIKTIGDSYFCVSGMPTLNHSHAINIINAAMELNQFITDRRKEKEEKGEVGFEMRIGVHTGPVVAGVVGTK
jgi:hypothetical protein